MLRQILLSIDWTDVIGLVAGGISSLLLYRYGDKSVQYKKFRSIVDAGKPIADALAQTKMHIGEAKVKTYLSKK